MDIQIISASNAPKSVGPYSQATRAGEFIFCSGFDPKTGTLVDGGIREQTRQVLRNLEAVLKEAEGQTGAMNCAPTRGINRNC